MINKRFWIALLILIVSGTAHADQFSKFAEAHNVLDARQLNWPNKPFPVELKLFGYVKAEGIFDTRQNFELRDGHLLYFPLNKLPDVNGADINARGEFEAFAIQTRWDLSGIGPDICNFESNFLIEAEFFGRTDEVIDSCDLRLAYLELRSDVWEFQGGQNFHPICYPYDSPDTISFNAGIPMAPFALCPQFKITYHQDQIEFLAAAIGFLGDRPFGFAGGTDKAFRDAIMPDFFVQFRYKADEDKNYVGVGFDVNRIVPRISTRNNYKEISPVTSISADLFVRGQYDDFVMYSKLMYSQDAGIFELIGGIAVHSIEPVTDIRTYTPLQTLGWYIELIKQGPLEPGLFIGVAKALGSLKTIIPSLESAVTVYGLGTDIDTVFRVSPRIRWYIKSFIVGIEYEYTRAAYGILDTHGHIQDAVPVANNRFLFATYYIF